MRKKMNKYFSFGVLFNGIFLFLNGLHLLPELIRGFCFGLAISFFIMGILEERNLLKKVKNYKKSLFR